MTQVPVDPIVPAAEPPPSFGFPVDLNRGVFIMQEQARRLRASTDAEQAAGRNELIAALGDNDELRQYTKAYLKSMFAMPTDEQLAVLDIRGEQEAIAQRRPIASFAADVFAGWAFTAQEMGMSAVQVAGTLMDAANAFPGPAGKALGEIADNYRARILSGQSADVGEFIQDLNIRAGRDTWGTSFGRLTANALPSLGAVMGGVQNARRAIAGVYGLFTTYSAGMGIEKYRRETIDSGKTPNAYTALLVGLGYGAAEFFTEQIDRIIPWQRISTDVAAKIGESILRRNPTGAARYITNALGLAATEGLEEVIAGDAQEFIDLALIDGKYDRTAGDRMGDFWLGAAGSAIVSAAGVGSSHFREAMMEVPTPLTLAGVDRQMASAAQAFLATEEGRSSAIGQAFARLKAPAVIDRTVATEKVTAEPAPIAPNVEDAVAEYRRALGEVGVGVQPRQLSPEELSPAQAKVIEGWSKRGITVIPIAPDPSNPLPAFTSSQQGVVIVEMTPNAKVNEVLAEIALIAHEAAHVLRAERPDVYGPFVEAAAGPIMAAGRQYADIAAGMGIAEQLQLDNADRLIDEGGAMLFQDTIERAGLASVLAQNELGIIRSATDFVRRTATKLGLRGPAVQAVHDAFKAVGTIDTHPPVQPAADVVAEVKAPRFAARPRGEANPDPKRMLQSFGTQLSRRIMDLDVDFRALRTDMAEFASVYATSAIAGRAQVLQATTPAKLRNALADVFNQTTVRHAEAMARGEAAAAKINLENAKAKFEQRIRAIKDFEAARNRQLTQIRKDAASIVSALPEKNRGAFLKAVATVSTPEGIVRLYDKVGQKIERLERTEAMAAAREAIAKATKAKLDPDEMAVAQEFLDEYGIKEAADLKGLDTAQLVSLAKQLNAVAAISKRRIATDRLARRNEIAQAAEVMTGEAISVAKAERKANARRLQMEVPEFSKGSKRLANLFHGMLMKPDTLAMYGFGEGSTGYAILYQGPAHGSELRLSAFQSDLKFIFDALAKAGLPKGSASLAQASQALSNAYGRKWSGEKMKPIEYDTILHDGTVLKMTMAERISILGSMTHPGTLSLMQGGTQWVIRRTKQRWVWTDADIAAFKVNAKPEEQAIVAAMRSRYNGAMAGRLREYSIDARGYDMSEENHWPRHRELEPAVDIADWTNISLQRSGILQEKTPDRNKPVFVEDAFVDYWNRSWRLNSIVYLERPIDFARRALANKDLIEAMGLSRRVDLRRNFTDLFNKMVEEGLLAPQFRGGLTDLARATRTAQRNFLRSVLPFNPRIWAYQPLGLLNAVAVDPALHPYIQAALGRGAPVNRSLDRIIEAGDPWLFHRMETASFGLFSESDEGSRGIAGFKPGVIDWGMAALGKQDHRVTRTILYAYMLKAQHEYPTLTKDETNVRALALTNRNIKQSQATFDLMHQSGLARRGREGTLSRLAGTLMSQQSASFNIIMRDAMRARRAPSPKSMAKVAHTLGFTLAATAIGTELVRTFWSAIMRALGSDAEDERTLMTRMLDSLQQTVLGTTPYTNIFGGFISRAMGRPGSEGSIAPLIDTTEDTLGGATALGVDTFKRLSNAALNTKFEVNDRDLWGRIIRSAQGVAQFAGIPITPIRMIDRVVRPPKKKKRRSRSGISAVILS